MSKILGFVQPNFQQGPQELNAFYLPYSAGVIVAATLEDPEVRRRWSLGPLIWRRDDIDITAQSLAVCDIVGFSTYVWNHRYNYALARRVKEINPTCAIVFGGPEPAIKDPLLFQKEPFMDVVVKLEGELAFRDLLLKDPEEWRSIPGLLTNEGGQMHDTGPSQRIDDLDQLPSPYLTGIFSDIIKQNPDVVWNATLETNRGCPYQCTFCDWGSLTYNKVKKFGLEKVFKELDWIGQNCGFVTIADANFGMFVERDNLIIDHLLHVQQRWGKLTNFSMTWAKNQRNEVVDIVKKIIEHSPGSGQGLTVSVQSMDADVLTEIKRRNLDQHKIDDIFHLCDVNNIPVYTEIILGLPGDTVEKWKQNFWKIFRAGNHSGINILQAQLLENAEMNLLQRRLWDIQTIPVYDYMSGSYGDTISESVEVVISTKNISKDQMLDTMTWNTMMQTFHINGLTTFVSRFLHKYQNLDYSDFYLRLENDLVSNEWLRQEMINTRSYYESWVENQRTNHPDIGGIKIFGWNLIHRISLLIYQQRRLPDIFQWLETFFEKHFDLPDDLLAQLLKFQKNYVIDWYIIDQWPQTEEFDYDFLGYLQNDTDLHRSVTYKFDTPEDKNCTLDRFLEDIYFARKRNFGKAVITDLTKLGSQTLAIAK